MSVAFVLWATVGLGPLDAQSRLAPARAPEPSPPTVVTTGEATLRAAPDRAFISLSTTARAQTPAAAQRQSADAMASVRKVLQSSDIADQAIRTVRYDVVPLFDYVNGRQVPRGYQAINSIEIRIDTIDRIGAVLDTVVNAGATEVGAVRFDLKDRDALEREALRQAVSRARGKADAAAAGAGQRVEAVLRIEESARFDAVQPVIARMTAERAAAEPTPIAPGEIEVTARVTVTARLSQR